MAGLGRRIEALERLYTMGERSGLQPDLEQRRAELRESLQRAWERAKQEELAGDSRRRRALEELERSMQERVRLRRSGGA